MLLSDWPVQVVELKNIILKEFFIFKKEIDSKITPTKYLLNNDEEIVKT